MGKLTLRNSGIDKLMKYLGLGLVLVPVFIMLFSVVSTAVGGGVEFNAVSLWMPENMYGMLGVINAPLNVSSSSLLSYANVYVIDESGKPYYSYLFSSNPPVVSVLDAGMSSKFYNVFYGGSNPYSSYVALPGQVPIYATYDDFDYDSGMWVYRGESHEIGGSELVLRNATMYLNVSYTPSVIALWRVEAGATAYRVVIYSATNYTGWVHIRLDETNFVDWGSIINGYDDVFFTDDSGNPLHYIIAYVDKPSKLLDAYVNITIGSNEQKIIYMFYGRENPYINYRQDPTQAQLNDITIQTTATPTTTTRITYTEPTTTQTITTTATIQPGDIIAPHLYDWYFDGTGYVEYNYGETIWAPFYVEVGAVPYDKSSILNIFSTRVSYSIDKTFDFKFSRGNMIHGDIGNGTNWLTTNADIQLNYNVYNYYVIAYNVTSDSYAIYVWDGEYHSTSGMLSNLAKLTDAQHVPIVGASIPYSITTNRFYGIIKYVRVNVLGVDKLMLDPTYFNGTNYIDIVSRAIGTPYGGVIRVPAKEKWLWVVEGEGDDYLHLRFFPVGSVVRFYDNSSGVLVGWVVVDGVPNGAGLVEDFAVPVPAGAYRVEAVVPVSGRGFTTAVGTRSAVNGLGRFAGSLPFVPCETGTVYDTLFGGTLWCEYVTADGYSALWFVPGARSGSDYVGSSGGSLPFDTSYYHDFVSSSELYASQIGSTVLSTTINTTFAKLEASFNTTLAKLEAVLNADSFGSVVVPHLYDWLIYPDSNITYDLNSIITVYKISPIDVIPQIVSANDSVSDDTPVSNPINLTSKFQLYWNGKTRNNSYGRIRLITPYGDEIIIQFRNYYTVSEKYNQVEEIILNGEIVASYIINHSTLYYDIEIESNDNITILGNTILTDRLGTVLTLPYNITAVEAYVEANYGADESTYTYAEYRPITSDSLMVEKRVSEASLEWETVYKMFGGGSAVLVNITDIAIVTRYNATGAFTFYNESIISGSGLLGLTLNSSLLPEAFIVIRGYSFINSTMENLTITITNSSITEMNSTIINDPANQIDLSTLIIGNTDVPIIVKYFYLLVNGSLYLMADPTFYNGTNYLTIGLLSSSKINGNIQRILTEKPELRTFKNYFGDGNTHFRYFPNGTKIEVYDNTTGELVRKFVINGTVNDAGLIEDYTITLDPGTYTIKAIIPKQTTLAPHLYDWFMEWGGYVKVTQYDIAPINATPTFVIYGRGKLTREATGGTPKIVLFWGENGYTGLFYNTAGSALMFVHRTYDNNAYEYSASYPLSIGSWTEGLGIINYSSMTISLTELLTGLTDTDPISSEIGAITGLYIGSSQTDINQFEGYISFIVAGHDMNISNRYIVTNPEVFIDSSFFDGYHYKDVAGGGIGTPYGSVRRVPARDKWLWVVYDEEGSGYINLRFFPVGTVVEIYDNVTGVLVKRFTIDGSANAVGLIEDYRLYLPIGAYTINVIIPKQVTIAPHLYDWHFDGVDDYVVLGYAPDFDKSYGSLVTRVKILEGFELGGVYRIFITDVNSQSWSTVQYQLGATSSSFVFIIGNGSASNVVYSSTSAYIGKWNTVAGALTPSTLEIYINGSLDNTASRSIDPIYPVSSEPGIAKAIDKIMAMYMSYLVITHNIYKGDNTTFDYHDVMLFIDPSFFNGTVYFDLANSNNYGISYGGVERVPAKEKWLWVINSGFDYGNVIFRFVPDRTRIVVSNASGVVTELVLTGGNDVGLVESYSVSLMPGVYNVSVVMPDPELSYSSLINSGFSGARDSYASVLSGTYTGINASAEVGLFDAGVMNGSAKPVVVWGDNPVTDYGLGWVITNVTVIEYRFYVSEGTKWAVWLLNVSDGDPSTPEVTDSPLLKLYYNGSDVVLIYALDNATVVTGLAPPWGWVYLYLAFEPGGKIEIGLGDGRYLDGQIYENLSTFAYTATKWGTISVVPVIGLHLDYNDSFTIGVDWYRVRPDITVSIIGVESVQLRDMMVYNITGFPEVPEWVMMINMTDVYGFRFSIPLLNSSLTLRLGSVAEVASPTEALGYASGTYLYVLNGSDVLGMGYVGVPFDGYLAIELNRSSLAVYKVSDGGSVSEVVSVLLNEPVVVGVPQGFVIGGSGFVYELMYVLNNTAVFGAVTDAKPSIAMVGGRLSTFRLGWVSYPTNSTVVDGYVKVNSTGVWLEVNMNGSVTGKKIGDPHSPAVVMVGYNFDDVLNMFRVFAQYVWSEEGITRYVIDYLDVPAVSEVASATPYVDANESLVGVEKVAITLGDVVEYMAKGIIRISIDGPVPVGGLIKYVTLTNPVKIVYSGGTVTVVPSDKPGITFVGFKGWVLNLGISGTTVSGVLIASDEYTVDVPLGFSAMIIADPSSRQISIVAAQSPQKTIEGGVGNVTTGTMIPVATPPLPPSASTGDYTSLLTSSVIVLMAMFASIGIAVFRLSGEVGMALIVPGLAAMVLFAALGAWEYFGVSIVVTVVGIIVRVAGR